MQWVLSRGGPQSVTQQPYITRELDKNADCQDPTPDLLH